MIIGDGIDPGSTAGAAMRLVADDRSVRVLRASYWRKVSNSWRVVEWAGGVHRVRSAVADHEWVAQVLWGAAPSVLVVEDAFVGPNPRGAISLARSTQAVMSGCRMAWLAYHQVTPPIRPILEASWRRVLSARKSTRDGSRPDEVPALMTALVPNLRDVIRVLGDTPHVYDACAVAYIGIRHRLWEDDWKARIAPAGGAVRPKKRRTRTRR